MTVSVESFTEDGLSSASAESLLALANRNDEVRRVLQLLAHVDRDWIWFDLYRIWDVIKEFSGNQNFYNWIDALWTTSRADRISFENSANDPGLGPDRRHALARYQRRGDDVNGVRTLGPDEAMALTKRVLLAWIAWKHDTEL